MSTWSNLVDVLSTDAKIYLNTEIDRECTALKPSRIMPLSVTNPGSAIAAQVKVHTYRYADVHKHLKFPEFMLTIGNTLEGYRLNPGRTPRGITAATNTNVFQGVSVSGVPTTLIANVLEQNYMTIDSGRAVRAKAPGCSAESFW